MPMNRFEFVLSFMYFSCNSVVDVSGVLFLIFETTKDYCAGQCSLLPSVFSSLFVAGGGGGDHLGIPDAVRLEVQVT